ncbi:reverse transcriptase domain-containing protein [Egbenema bharatensis]|uniref:reverse transcriptase domain-containing protein n=1 Tax=Egbenema bharatensis TaxID=3463334 RepID=UPI003A89A03C
MAVRYDYFIYRLYKIPHTDQYTSFDIPKKNGGSRTILAPSSTLKILQRKLSQVLYCVYRVKPSVHGYAPQKNIVTNAHVHSNKRYVLNLDLKNFFGSINFGRVRGMFMAKPYNLNAEVATVLAQICCHNNQLPQGAPTSPIVSNMLCAKLDSQLQQLAKKYSCTYTRYADDITFSTTLPKFPHQLASTISDEDKDQLVIGEALAAVIESNGFEVNYEKIRLQDSKNRQRVTGLTVNKFPNVDRRYVRQIRAMLHSWEKYGLDNAESYYEAYYSSEEANFPGKDTPSYKQVVLGRINFLGMVRGKNDLLYKKYLEKYKYLAKRSL